LAVPVLAAAALAVVLRAAAAPEEGLLAPVPWPGVKFADKFFRPLQERIRDVAHAHCRKMLEEAKPQAVVIAVPLFLHQQVASDAVAAGCDVFCEKTMCYSVEQCRKLVDQVEKSQCVFQVGLQRRANPIYQQAAAMVKAGMLGEVTAIKSQWHRNNSWPKLDKEGKPADTRRGIITIVAAKEADQWKITAGQNTNTFVPP
jgi:predicted dehydrogenase